MFIKNSFSLTIGWAMLTVLAISVAVMRIIQQSSYQISLLIAVLMFIVFIYILILRRVDGPSFMHSLNDERLWHISATAQRVSFWFLFISIWCLAAALEFLEPIFLMKYISLFLASIGTTGLFIYMFCFVWQKYRVQD